MGKHMKGFRILCVVLLLTVTLSAVTMAQSMDTTSNGSVESNQTSVPQANNSTNGLSSSGTSLPESSQQSPSESEASDNSPDNATSIKVGEQVTGQLPVGDQDWTTFRVDSDREISVSVMAQNQTNMSAFIYSDRELLQSAYIPPGSRMSLNAPVNAGGQYYVFVRNEAPNTPGSYSFQVSESNSSTSETPIAEANEPEPDNGSSGLEPFRIFGILVAIALVIAAGHTLFKRREEDEDVGEKAE